MTPALVAHLKHFEGWVPHPYYCAAGKLTIGYGHRINEPRPDLTPAEGEALLLEDIAKYEEMALRITGGDAASWLTGPRLDAITDFCFNVGGSAYAGSHLRMRVQARDWPGAAKQNDLWVYVTDPKSRKQYVSRWQVQRRAATSAWLKAG